MVTRSILTQHLCVISSYGFTLHRREHVLNTLLITEKDWARHLRRGNFAGAMEVGRPGRESSVMEISKAPDSITISAPILLGFVILCNAKLHLIRFHTWLRR